MHTGYGLVLGAALGLLAGALFAAATWLGPLIGAGVGLLVGAIVDAQHPGDDEGRRS